MYFSHNTPPDSVPLLLSLPSAGCSLLKSNGITNSLVWYKFGPNLCRSVPVRQTMLGGWDEKSPVQAFDPQRCALEAQSKTVLLLLKIKPLFRNLSCLPVVISNTMRISLCSQPDLCGSVAFPDTYVSEMALASRLSFFSPQWATVIENCRENRRTLFLLEIMLTS